MRHESYSSIGGSCDGGSGPGRESSCSSDSGDVLLVVVVVAVMVLIE